jgi:hypothetical protein
MTKEAFDCLELKHCPHFPTEMKVIQVEKFVFEVALAGNAQHFSSSSCQTFSSDKTPNIRILTG